MSDLAVFAILLAVVSLFRERLKMLPLTPPMLYVGAGLILGPKVLGVVELGLEDESVVLLAELTLALLLFSDAARIDTRPDRLSFGFPARLLAIGLPLTIGLGTLVTRALLPDLTWAQAALVATILAPTDAALGEAVVTNPAVPVRIRQALNVESGLNDGLVVPVFTLLLAIVAGSEIESVSTLVGEAAGEIAIGVLVGAATAIIMSFIIPAVKRLEWTDGEGLRLVALGCGLAAYAGAEVIGGNGFLAAFAAGLIASKRIGPDVAKRTELAEDIGQIGASITFVLFGALLVVPAMESASFAVLFCALGTLTVGRMLPVAISLMGTGLKFPTVVFMGWFGPRGLASMLFGLLVVTEGDIDTADDLFSVVVLVILASVVLHGMTAAPWAQKYGRWFEAHGVMTDDMPEAEAVMESRTRGERATNE
jgi:NhaP-type Na+/H+ or K+/H+ antiporter